MAQRRSAQLIAGAVRGWSPRVTHPRSSITLRCAPQLVSSCPLRQLDQWKTFAHCLPSLSHLLTLPPRCSRTTAHVNQLPSNLVSESAPEVPNPRQNKRHRRGLRDSLLGIRTGRGHPPFFFLDSASFSIVRVSKLQPTVCSRAAWS